MITIKGKQFSEETIIVALEKHCNFKGEGTYIFKAGDVVVNSVGNHRVIVWRSGELASYSPQGYFQLVGQQEFENCDYKKVGILSDFINNNK